MRKTLKTHFQKKKYRNKLEKHQRNIIENIREKHQNKTLQKQTKQTHEKHIIKNF